MTNTQQLPGSEPNAEPSPQQGPRLERVKPKLMSDAAVDRQLKKLFIRLLGSDVFWDWIDFAGGLFFISWPIHSKVRKNARRYRNKPDVFFESLRRLVGKKCVTDPQYGRNWQEFQHFCAAHFGESSAASPKNPKLKKYQRRKKAEMLELLEIAFLSLGRTPSDVQGQKITTLLNELPKVGSGRTIKPDSGSARIIRAYENGVRGNAALAKFGWPDEWAKAKTTEEKNDKKRLLKDRTREVIRRYKKSLE